MNNPIRALIVDDEPLARQLIHSLVENDEDIQVVGQCANGQQALETIRAEPPELVFLDIQMPGLSGFQLLERLEPGEIPYIIFITAYDQYALRAFEIHALDYLLKPFDKERFYESVNRAKLIIRRQALNGLADKILQLTRDYPGGAPVSEVSGAAVTGAEPHRGNGGAESYLEEIVIRDGGRLLAVKTGDIVWLEAANQYLRVHAKSGSHLLSKSLDTVFKQLDPERFFRIHRSAVVNAAFIKEVRTARNGTCDIILSTGKKLKLSRSRKSILPKLLQHCS